MYSWLYVRLSLSSPIDYVRLCPADGGVCVLQARRVEGAKVPRVEIALPMHLKSGGSRRANGTTCVRLMLYCPEQAPIYGHLKFTGQNWGVGTYTEKPF